MRLVMSPLSSSDSIAAASASWSSAGCAKGSPSAVSSRAWRSASDRLPRRAVTNSTRRAVGCSALRRRQIPLSSRKEPLLQRTGDQLVEKERVTERALGELSQ